MHQETRKIHATHCSAGAALFWWSGTELTGPPRASLCPLGHLACPLCRVQGGGLQGEGRGPFTRGAHLPAKNSLYMMK